MIELLQLNLFILFRAILLVWAKLIMHGVILMPFARAYRTVAVTGPFLWNNLPYTRICFKIFSAHMMHAYRFTFETVFGRLFYTSILFRIRQLQYNYESQSWA